MVSKLRFKNLLRARRATRRAFFDDTEFHHSRTWRGDGLPPSLSTLDPRLVALELDSLQSHNAMVGPVLLAGGIYFTTVVLPVDDFRVVVALFKEPTIAQLLEQQTRFWGLQTFVFDRSGNAVYTKGDAALVAPSLSPLLADAASGKSAGWVLLKDKPHWTLATTPTIQTGLRTGCLSWPNRLFGFTRRRSFS